jgi:phage/plasmid primase-like uncharacterized protein
MRNRNPRSKLSRHFTSAADLRRIAAGQWVEILRDAGLPPAVLEDRRGKPCPRCGGRDRFNPLPDVAERGAVLCRHCFHGSTEPRAGDGIATLRWWFACDTRTAIEWLRDRLGIEGDGRWATLAVRRPEPVTVRARPAGDDSMRLMVETCARNMRPAWLNRAAELLGLDPEPLRRLEVGWSPVHRATTWPMRNGEGEVIGVRLRCPETARKWALRGSRAGLIYPQDLSEGEPAGRLYVCEGPTDAAALLSIGLSAVGVPSAGYGGDLLFDLLLRIGIRDVVIVADADGPGHDGALRLARELAMVAIVRVIRPDAVKDARAWVCAGADGATLEAAADAACPLSFENGRAAQ